MGGSRRHKLVPQSHSGPGRRPAWAATVRLLAADRQGKDFVPWYEARLAQTITVQGITIAAGPGARRARSPGVL